MNGFSLRSLIGKCYRGKEIQEGPHAILHVGDACRGASEWVDEPQLFQHPG